VCAQEVCPHGKKMAGHIGKWFASQWCGWDASGVDVVVAEVGMPN
jgi:hypothetical protein